MELKDRFGGILNQATALFGLGDPGTVQELLMDRLEETRTVINKVNAAFQDPELTTFVCVCIPEFLSLYETERCLLAQPKSLRIFVFVANGFIDEREHFSSMLNWLSCVVIVDLKCFRQHDRERLSYLSTCSRDFNFSHFRHDYRASGFQISARTKR